MGKPRSFTRLTLLMSGCALAFSALAIGINVYQFFTQNRSDLLANCAFDRDARSKLETVFEPYRNYSEHNRYNLNTEVKCLILNNGRKAVSVVRIRSVLTYDGRPIGEVTKPISLFENDLVDKSQLPMVLAPGESRETNVWLKVNVGALTAEAISECKDGQDNLETYGDYDVCFHQHGFSIGNHVYVEPYPGYNGVGLQFVTNENMSITFDVSALRASMIATRGEMAKEYNEKNFRPTYNEEGIYLERGYREILQIP